MPSPFPIFVGRFTRQIDQQCRLRIPAPWRIYGVRSWLLYPRDLLADAPAQKRTLCLDPIYARLPRAVCDTLNVPTDRPRTLATAIEALRTVALRRGLDPTTVTHHRTGANGTHLMLSPAQLARLRPQSRSLVLIGTMLSIEVWSAEEFARWERSVSHPPKHRVRASRR